MVQSAGKRLLGESTCRPKHEGRGRSEKFSDTAIECCLVLRSLFHLPLRGTQGFVVGVLRLLGLGVDKPYYMLLCKRARSLVIDLKALPKKEPLNPVIDSTGLKICSECEWKVRIYGKSKRRSWKSCVVCMRWNWSLRGFRLQNGSLAPPALVARPAR